jgi:hypothetical protein
LSESSGSRKSIFFFWSVDVIQRKMKCSQKQKLRNEQLSILQMAPRRSNPAFDSCNVKKLTRTVSPTCVTAFVVVVAAPTMAAPPKSVYFCQVVKVACILHINDYTEEEIAACWYNDNECHATKDNVAQCASRILEQEDETEDFCRRGLEFRTPRGARQCMENKENGWEAVLEVQAMQREHNWHYDPLNIALVYHKQTKHCLLAAQFQALKDAKEAGYC